ncbi:MAG: hypothetical protein K1060chlam1_00028 [Candidatus Anoxychlamydiales bacterium]|nr:hypothetical protein [Candidatus Anoxychlamydiales bacterium]
MSSFTVLNWNFGADKEYGDILDLREGEATPTKETLLETRNRVATTAFKTLIESNQVDIICLQNAGNNLDRIKSWLGEDFEVARDGKNTAVAYKRRFELEGVDLSPDISNNHSYTILTLKDLLTEKTYKVASAHLFFDIKEEKQKDSIRSTVISSLEKILSILGEAENSIIGLQETTDTDNQHNNTLLLKINTLLKTNGFLSSMKGQLSSIYTKRFSSEIFEIKLQNDPENNPSPHMPVIERLSFGEVLQKAEEESGEEANSQSSSSSSSSAAKGQQSPKDTKDTPDSTTARTPSTHKQPDTPLPGEQLSATKEKSERNGLSQSNFVLSRSPPSSPEPEVSSDEETTNAFFANELSDDDLADELFQSTKEGSPPPSPERAERPPAKTTPLSAIALKFVPSSNPDDGLLLQPAEEAAPPPSPERAERPPAKEIPVAAFEEEPPQSTTTSGAERKKMKKTENMRITFAIVALIGAVALPLFARLYKVE